MLTKGQTAILRRRQACGVYETVTIVRRQRQYEREISAERGKPCDALYLVRDADGRRFSEWGEELVPANA